jgi:toxin-antitoxin system, antitoxin component, xre family
MATNYGKVLRKIRVDRDELLKDMAGKLGITSAYLSSIENGKRQIPTGLTRTIAEKYELNHETIKKLEEAEDNTRTSIQFDFTDANENQKTTVLKLARQFSDLSDEQLAEIRRILSRKDG